MEVSNNLHYRIFISKSSDDNDKAVEINKLLKSSGFSTWIDFESIKEGKTYTEEIMEAIQICDLFLILLSNSSAYHSEDVYRELHQAGNRRKHLPILPVYLNGFTVGALPHRYAYFLNSIHGLSWESLQDHSQLLTEVREALSIDDIDSGEPVKTQSRKEEKTVQNGSAFLIYPYAELCDIIASDWTQVTLSKDWIEIDQQYRIAKESESEKIARIPGVKEIARDDFFIQFVTQARHNDLAERIKRSCGYNSRKHTGHWSDYLREINAYIQKEVLPTLESNKERNQFHQALKNIKQDYRGFSRNNTDILYDSFDEYKMAVLDEIDAVSPEICYDLFPDTEDVSRPSHLLHWLKSKDDTGFHPLATRFFLYQALKEMELQFNQLKDELDGIDAFFDAEGEFENQLFSYRTEEKVVETRKQAHMEIENYNMRVIFSHEIIDSRARFIDAYSIADKKLDEYRSKSIYYSVLETGIDFLSSLSRQYESFFDSLFDLMENIVLERNMIYEKLMNAQCVSRRYICTSEKCLKKLSVPKKNHISAKLISPELCNEIYMELREHSLNEYSEADDSENRIPDLYLNAFSDACKKLFDVDVLEALLMEAEYEIGSIKLDKKILYVSHVLQDTIESLHMSPHDFRHNNAIECSYPKELIWKSGAIGDLIRKYISKSQSTDESQRTSMPSISKYELIYYKKES